MAPTQSAKTITVQIVTQMEIGFRNLVIRITHFQNSCRSAIVPLGGQH
jgi:hypothetical protein